MVEIELSLFHVNTFRLIQKVKAEARSCSRRVRQKSSYRKEAEIKTLRVRRGSRSAKPASVGLKLLEQLYEQGESPEKIIKQRVLPLLRATKTYCFRRNGGVQRVEVPDDKARLKGIDIALRSYGLQGLGLWIVCS